MMVHLIDLFQHAVNITVIAYLASRLQIRWRNGKDIGNPWIAGILYGIFGSLYYLLNLVYVNDTTSDFQALLAGIVSFASGPVAAMITALVLAVTSLLCDPTGAVANLIVIAFATFAGIILHLCFRGFRAHAPSFWQINCIISLFGLLVAGVEISLAALLPPAYHHMSWSQALPLLFYYPGVSLLIYFIIKEDRDRHFETLYDRVTRLPKTERLRSRWQRFIDKRQPFSFVILNVEKMRSINDLYGVHVGDQLLLECSNRIHELLPDKASVCRNNGHDFVVFMPGYDMLQTLIWLVDTKKRLSLPYRIGDNLLQVTFSSGLATYDGDSDDATIDDIIVKAKTALRYAMDSGTNQTVPYESKLTEQWKYRISLEKDLIYALDRNQLQLHYQPQYALDSGKLRGFEALLRWNHPEWGPISPAEFIPLAEDTRLIIPIGEWVLETACTTAMRLNLDKTGETIAVNISAIQLLEPDFPDRVFAILDRTGLPGSQLELELTESTLVRNFEQASAQLNRLKKRGIRLALDDFGVGYSSLSYLRRLPFDLIKIDRSFIEDVERFREDQIVKSIIEWIKELRYGIVAEGLESNEQLYWLKQWNCDIAQGYLFSKPIPEPDLHRKLRQIIALPATS
jgi:diguanylate cyclase (GGDEF)-like protein